VAEMASAIQLAVLVQLAAGVVVLVTAWMIADRPLSAVRASTEQDGPSTVPQMTTPHPDPLPARGEGVPTTIRR